MQSRVSVTVPIWFSLIRMALAIPPLMPCLNSAGFGHEIVVADKLNLVTQFLGDLLPSGAVVLSHAVPNRPDLWILPNPALAESNHLLRRLPGFVRLVEGVASIFEELARPGSSIMTMS